jgi:hypothetical protein
MKSLLAKCAYRKSFGLYVGDHEVVLCLVADTILGPIEISRRNEPYEPDQLPAVLQKLLGPYRDRHQAFRKPLALGLPELRVFYSTRPIQATDRELSPQVLLHEVLQSPTIVIDEMAVDMIQSQPGKRTVASLVSCRRKYLAGLLSALEGCGVKPYRAEPAPCAVLRAAAQQHHAPRKAKTVLRAFLGADQGIVALVAGELPLVWRSFDLNPGGEAEALVSACMALQILGKYCGVETRPDAVLIHGRPDLAGAIGSDTVQTPLATRVIHHPGPALDGGSIARGLAIGCQPQFDGFDLARTLKPKPTLREIFPWGELGIQAVILLCVSLLILAHGQDVDLSHRAVRAEAARFTWLAKVEDSKLEKERKDLEQKVKTVETFLSGRTIWTAYTEDLSTQLPENIQLRSFSGLCEASTKKEGAKPKKSYILKLAAPIAQGGGIPQEIDAYLSALRKHPLLKRDFPNVELADLRWSQAASGKKAVADFTVVCLPRLDKAPARPGAGGETKGEAK